MRVLNLEDSASKHFDIVNVLESVGVTEIDWVTSLDSGLKKLIDNKEKKYDLIISDMYYPINDGGFPVKSGYLLMEKLIDEGIKTPVVICSSAHCVVPEAHWVLHYSLISDWEYELRTIIREMHS